MIMQELNNAEPVPFEITPTSLENVKKVKIENHDFLAFSTHLSCRVR